MQEHDNGSVTIGGAVIGSHEENVRCQMVYHHLLVVITLLMVDE